MPETVRPVRPLLDPIDRVSEMLFGLIMVLTFTGSLSVAEAGHAEVRDMLIGALGCNLAWGLIDAIFYLMGCLAANGRSLVVWRSVRQSTSREQAYQRIADALPPLAARALGDAEFESIRLKLTSTPAPPSRPTLSAREWLGALSVFAWVFLITFPVVIPFLWMEDVGRAMRASNAVALVLLYVAGHMFGRCTGGRRPWLLGWAMVGVGTVLVTITIALGG